MLHGTELGPVGVDPEADAGVGTVGLYSARQFSRPAQQDLVDRIHTLATP